LAVDLEAGILSGRVCVQVSAPVLDFGFEVDTAALLSALKMQVFQKVCDTAVVIIF